MTIGYSFFQKKAWRERATYMTYHREIQFIRTIGDELAISTIGGGKKNFNTIFSQYIGREWLDINANTEKEFCDFCQKHTAVIIKTNGTCSGDNIYKYYYTTYEDACREYQKKKKIMYWQKKFSYSIMRFWLIISHLLILFASLRYTGLEKLSC